MRSSVLATVAMVVGLTTTTAFALPTVRLGGDMPASAVEKSHSFALPCGTEMSFKSIWIA